MWSLTLIYYISIDMSNVRESDIKNCTNYYVVDMISKKHFDLIKILWCTKESNENRHLTLVHTDEGKSTQKKYEEL